jgi:hypothetical protein
MPVEFPKADDELSYKTEPAAREEAIQWDHAAAIKRQAVEQYLLNELAEEERARFEQHYFECAECADAVAAGQTFLSHIGPQPSRRVWWQQPAAAIAALFLAVVGGQQFVIAQLTAPHANSVIFVRPLEKGVPYRAYTLRTPSATIEVSLPSDATDPFYLVKIAGGQGRMLSQVVPAPLRGSDQRLSVQLSRRTLGPGHFTVEIAGLNREDAKVGTPLGEGYEFDLK